MIPLQETSLYFLFGTKEILQVTNLSLCPKTTSNPCFGMNPETDKGPYRKTIISTQLQSGRLLWHLNNPKLHPITCYDYYSALQKTLWQRITCSYWAQTPYQEEKYRRRNWTINIMALNMTAFHKRYSASSNLSAGTWLQIGRVVLYDSLPIEKSIKIAL